ncbi:MAG TPA: hypothetical protein VM842_01225 [Nitrospira sp.]|nr:hypothetical protein [Nitrospira sp.]
MADAFSLGSIAFDAEGWDFRADFGEAPTDFAALLAFVGRLAVTVAFFFAGFGAAFLTLFLVTAFFEDIAFGLFTVAFFLAVLLFFVEAVFFALTPFLALTFLDRALFTAVLFFLALFFAIPRPPLRSSPWHVGGKAASI